MERPCPEYFNGIKYNTTREYSSLARFPERRFGKKGGLWTLNRTPTQDLRIAVAITPEIL